MSNKEVYDKVFIESFSINQSQLTIELEYDSIKEWDSVGHMTMVAGLEEAFDIVLEMDDIIDFSSYEVGKVILGNYDVII
jgi:acyl carrier protein